MGTDNRMMMGMIIGFVAMYLSNHMVQINLFETFLGLDKSFF